MENNQQYTELELIRSQMEDFKSQLDKQKIVSEKLILSSMKKSMSWIKNYIYFEFLLIPIIALTWFGIKEFAHLSWYSYLFMMTVITIDVIADYRINISALTDADYSRNNLLTTITKLTRMKHQRSIQMILSIPSIVLWILWSGIEAWINLPIDAPDFTRVATYGGLVGAIIGGILGVKFAFDIFHKMQHTNDDLISQIHELCE